MSKQCTCSGDGLHIINLETCGLKPLWIFGSDFRNRTAEPRGLSNSTYPLILHKLNLEDSSFINFHVKRFKYAVLHHLRACMTTSVEQTFLPYVYTHMYVRRCILAQHALDPVLTFNVHNIFNFPAKDWLTLEVHLNMHPHVQWERAI